LALALAPAARIRITRRRAWVGWGLAWFAAASVALTPIFPLWQPNRSQFGSVGLGVAAAALCAAAHPALAGALVAGRLALLTLAPAPAATISPEPASTGAFMDFAQLSRLQRLMAAAHRELRAGYANVPHHVNLVEMNLPIGAIYAFGGDHAVQTWYRDSTLHMVSFRAVAADSTLPTIAGVQFQPEGSPQIVLLSPAAMRTQDTAYRRLLAPRWSEAIAATQRADSLADVRYRVFHGDNAGYRAVAWYELGKMAEAEADSRRAIAGDALDENGLRVLAKVLAGDGRLGEALDKVNRLLALAPEDR